MPATRSWRGGGRVVAQVDRRTVGTVAAGNTLTVTSPNGNVFTYTCASATEADEATAFAAAWNADTATPEFQEVEASASGDDVLFTMKTTFAGKPFTFTYGAAGGAATFNASGTAGATSSGPNDFNVAANWSGGAVPVAGDTIVFEGTDVDCLYNLATLTGATLAAVRIEQTFTGKLGLPFFCEDGTDPYPEYRARYLAVGITTLTVGIGTGTGSPRLQIDGEAVQSAVQVYATGTSEDDTQAALVWKGTHVANTLEVLGGDVGVAPLAGETAVVATANVLAGTVYVSAGVTWTTLNVRGGTVELEAGGTTLVVQGGTVTARAGAVTTLTVYAGATVVWDSGGTVSTLNLYGTFDAEQDATAYTVTNATFYPGWAYLDGFGRGTWSNPFTLGGGADVADGTTRLGPGRTLLRG